jgi:hypothetical protein
MLLGGLVDQFGELALICTALALMNEVPCTYVPYRPAGTMRVGGRLRPYMSNSIVRIEVPATRRRVRDIERDLKRIGREKIRRKRHEVRGHFRHVIKLPRAQPERWERVAHPLTGRMVWRTWIEHFERGDGELGFVQHTGYEAVRGRGELPGDPQKPPGDKLPPDWHLDHLRQEEQEFFEEVVDKLGLRSLVGPKGGRASRSIQ